jgi:hypothetical protein
MRSQFGINALVRVHVSKAHVECVVFTALSVLVVNTLVRLELVYFQVQPTQAFARGD